MHPASAQAITSEDATAMATFLPRAIGPGDSFKLQLWSRIAFRFGYSKEPACRRSHVPSVAPPSTTMISAGASVWRARLDTSPSISSTSFRTVAITLIAGIPRQKKVVYTQEYIRDWMPVYRRRFLRNAVPTEMEESGSIFCRTCFCQFPHFGVFV